MDNRILVAAARGARLQRSVFRGPWEATLMRPCDTPVYEWRVHPDDTELLYCKVGRALRKAAVNPPALPSDVVTVADMPFMVERFSFCLEEVIGYRDADTETRRMFLLMLAEELSYEVLE